MKNPFQRLLHRYTYDLKLMTKLIISHTIPLMIPAAVLILFLFMQIYRIIVDDAVRSEQALSIQTTTSIQGLTSHAILASDTLCANTVMQGLFNFTADETLAYELSPTRISNLCLTAKSLKDESLITDVRIYYEENPHGDLTRYNSSDLHLFQPASLIRDSGWYAVLQRLQTDSLFCPSSFLSPSEAQSSPGTLAYVTRLSRRDSASPQIPEDISAYVALYLSEELLNTVLRQNSGTDGKVSYLINSHGIVMAASNASLAETYLIAPDEFRAKLGAESTYQLVRYSSGSAYTAYFPISETNWYMISIIPEFHIAGIGRTILIHFGVVYLLLAVFSLFIAIRLSGSIAHRITDVAFQMEKVRTGRPLPLPKHDTGCDEIGVLTDTYNYMTEEINLLMDEQARISEDLRMAQFRALQAQINPHFLYNTLDMINWLAQTGRTREVTQAIQALSRFYKLTLSRKELLNTVADELEHVSLYMELQNMRFDNCVSFVIDVPDELNSFTLPKLTFQPIVENALLHGILMTEQKRGTILLTGWREGEDITFIISDDGAGIPPEKLDELMKGADGPAAPSSAESPGKRSMENGHFGTGYQAASHHIGVYNTNLRLKSLYGERYGLSFTSTPGQGTVVTVLIPARREMTS